MTLEKVADIAERIVVMLVYATSLAAVLTFFGFIFYMLNKMAGPP